MYQIDIEDVDGATGKGVRIAVLDTGIDYSHPDLAVRVDELLQCAGRGRGPTAWTIMGMAHHIAGIIAAKVSRSPGWKSPSIGMAPAARLLLCGSSIMTGGGFVSDLIHGLSWVYNQPEIRVVNIVWAFTKATVSPPAEDRHRALRRRCDYGGRSPATIKRQYSRWQETPARSLFLKVVRR